MSKVSISLSPTGEKEVKTEGVPGERCYDASRPYERALSGQTTDDQKTAEYNQPPMDQDIGQNEEQSL